MIFVLFYSLICPMYHHANNSISTIGYLFMRGVTYFRFLIIKLDRTLNDAISMNGRKQVITESNITVSSHTERSVTSYILFNTLLPPSERGLVNLKGNPRVSISYRTRTRVASTSVPDRSHYSTSPMSVCMSLCQFEY